MYEKVANMLINSNDYLSGQEISQMLGVSRQAIWKVINLLKSNGYNITSVTNKGYKIKDYPKHLEKVYLQSCLTTNVIAKNIYVLDSVSSTNDYLKDLGNNGCANGTVVVSREQTKGKGRLGRVWQTKKDDGIAVSILLRPNILPNEVSCITPLVGLAVCKAIREYTKLDCKIKWPNDIIVNNKKLVGILTEMSAEFDGVEYIIPGIGINVEHSSFPEEIAYKATSIFLETKEHINQNEFLACVLKHIEMEFINNDLKLTPNALTEYKKLCASIDKTVSFTRGTQTLTGVAVGVLPEGQLQIMLPDGSMCDVNSGEVVVQGIY